MNFDLSFLRAKLALPVDYKTIDFYLVVAGGTGSFMAMNLARLAFELKSRGKKTSITIVDFDRVEENNIPRSNFCFAEIGKNKAETLANRIAVAWGIETGFVKTKFEPSLLQNDKNGSWNQKLTVLVGCVDNHLARREMHEAVKFYNESKYGKRDEARLWWIDGGNGRDAGQVLIGNRLDKREVCESAQEKPILSLLPAPSLQHPELLSPPDKAKTIEWQPNETPNCPERIRLGEQSLNINQRVAVEMSQMLSELLLTHTLKRFASYFDLESGASRSLYSASETFADCFG